MLVSPSSADETHVKSCKRMSNKYKTNPRISTTLTASIETNAVDYYGFAKLSNEWLSREVTTQQTHWTSFRKHCCRIRKTSWQILQIRANWTRQFGAHLLNASTISHKRLWIDCNSLRLDFLRIVLRTFYTAVNFVNEDNRSQQCRVDNKLYTCYENERAQKHFWRIRSRDYPGRAATLMVETMGFLRDYIPINKQTQTHFTQ